MNRHAYRRPDKVLIYLHRRPASGEIEYLLLQRTSAANSGNIWQTVVGGVEWDEDLVGAARREVYEETGLVRLQGITAVGYAFSFPIRLRPDQKSLYAPEVTTIRNTVFAAEVAGRRPVSLSEEHIESGWFPYDEALARIHWSEEKEALTRLHPMLAVQKRQP